MHRFIRGMLDNDSIFGQIMTRAGIIIGANLMFVLLAMPVVTIGPALAALYYVMLKVLRGSRELNPFKAFWHGFRTNFKQGMICWLALMALAAVLVMDISICRQAGGFFTYVMYATYVLAAAALVLASYLFPVMAAFGDTVPHLLRNAVYFIGHRPHKMLVIVFFNVFPLFFTYLDRARLPLYAFLWTMFGFGAVAMLQSSLLIRDFEVFLPDQGQADHGEPEGKTDYYQGKADRQTLEDMKRMGL